MLHCLCPQPAKTILCMTTAFPTIQQLSCEQQLADHWQHHLLPFWQQLHHGHFIGVGGVSIAYSFFQTAGATQAWVLSTGRMETAIKYSELLFELVQAGYSVFIMDHRGQGRSGRLLADPQPGHVDSFKHYQQDFAQFLTDIVIPQGHQQHFLLAHSMGSAISAGLLTAPEWPQWHHFFSAAVLCSPMLGIYSGPVPPKIAEGLALIYCRKLRAEPAAQAGYFPGQQPYEFKPFAGNDLTSSLARYQAMQACYQREPALQLGGVTCRWLMQAILAMRQLRRDAGHCQCPLLLLQGAADKVVANTMQQLWFNHLPVSTLKTIQSFPGARHELLMEQDSIRQQVLVSINQFLQQLPAR